MKTISFLYYVSSVIMVLCLSCHKANNENRESTELEFIKTLDKSNVSNDTIPLQKVINEPFDTRSDSIQFEARLDSITRLFSSLGFNREGVVELKELNQYREHWWLKHYFRRSTLGKTPEFPNERDLDKIKSVRQFVFKKAWKYYIEQWVFEDEEAAARWYQIAKYAHHKKGGYYLEKPPNDFLLEGDKLYFIMATAARDWFEYSDQLVEKFFGMTKAEIRKARQ